jgi:hypothetical protein
MFVSFKFQKIYKVIDTLFTKWDSADIQFIYLLQLRLVNRPVNPFTAFT